MKQQINKTKRSDLNNRPSFWRALKAVIWKDLAAEWRSREILSSMLVFALLVIFVLNFALELGRPDTQQCNSRCALGDLYLCRNPGFEPLHGIRERPGLYGWPFTCSG